MICAQHQCFNKYYNVTVYNLYQVCDMSEEMKAEAVEVIITACEKFGTDYLVRLKYSNINNLY